MNRHLHQNSLPKSWNGFGIMPTTSTHPSAVGVGSTFVVCSRMASQEHRTHGGPGSTPGWTSQHRRSRTSHATIRQPEPLGRTEGAPSLTNRDGSDLRQSPGDLCHRRYRVPEAGQAQSRPILETIKEWLDKEVGRVLPKSLMAEVIGYALNQKALERYLEAGFLEIDNGASERGLRPVAVGRYNWLFVGSEAGGKTAAILMSLCATCKRVGIDPLAYLRDVLERISTHPASRIAELVPDQWRKIRAGPDQGESPSTSAIPEGGGPSDATEPEPGRRHDMPRPEGCRIAKSAGPNPPHDGVFLFPSRVAAVREAEPVDAGGK